MGTKLGTVAELKWKKSQVMALVTRYKSSKVPPVRLNIDVPVELEQIIWKCLEKDRDLRYQHAADIRNDLQRLKRDTTQVMRRLARQIPALRNGA